jgi:hypothetical protein
LADHNKNPSRSIGVPVTSRIVCDATLPSADRRHSDLGDSLSNHTLQTCKLVKKGKIRFYSFCQSSTNIAHSLINPYPPSGISSLSHWPWKVRARVSVSVLARQ